MERLRAFGQEHLLAFYEQLPAEQQQRLLAEVEELDLPLLAELVRTRVLATPAGQVPPDLSPAPIWPATPRDAKTAQVYRDARRRGEELIARGQVAAMVVAGGDGTRLGFSGPKGCLNVSVVKRKPLFQMFAEGILATSRRYGSPVPWYIMTSQSNDAATRAFFAEHNFFGLPRGDVVFFTQGRMPAVGLDGKVLLAEKGRIAFNPDGHGGSLTALRRSGALADMARRGVRCISYFQVDNPLVHCVDPLFVGLHDLQGAQMSAKALPKRDPLEKLGNFCLSGGKVHVIEYSDLPEELARATRPDGTLTFSAGSIAIHVLSREFVERLTDVASRSTSGPSAVGMPSAVSKPFRLPFHRASKKVAHVAPDGTKISPDKPNAVKFEMFVFDAMTMADTTVILQTPRDEEFSPVKNATGEDSLATCLHDQVRRAAVWLETAGVAVPRDVAGQVAAAIEISPLLALDAEQLAQRVAKGLKIKPGEQVCLE
jgi:UDP-N-acetylglucosamine/UDP-N-acetylgalactosamine diphosphorylase